MKDKKIDIKFFTIFQYQQEEKYLSSMHEMGWRLVKITFPCFYHFEKCQPERAAYRLDYNQEGIRNKTEYVQMFSDCGWKYLFDFVGYSYFYKEGAINPESEEIFCDDFSRLDMMKRVFKGRIIPLIIIFAGVVLPQLFQSTLGFGGRSVIQEGLSGAFMIVAMMYILMFGITAYQFYQYEKRVLPEHSGVKFKYFGVFLLMAFLVIGIVCFFCYFHRSVYSVSEGTDGYTVEAEQLNKSVVMEYNLKKGDVIEVSHQYDGGEIFIRIGEEGKEPIFYGNSYSGMGNFTVEIQEDGCYAIECSGRRAKGAVRFAMK